MYLYVAQDWFGNIHVSDDRDTLPPDVTDFHEVFLPEKRGYSEDATMTIQVGDYFNELISLDRKG